MSGLIGEHISILSLLRFRQETGIPFHQVKTAKHVPQKRSRLLEIVAVSYLQDHAMLGFTIDGNYLISYSMKLSPSMGASEEDVDMYNLHHHYLSFWSFCMNTEIKLIRSIRLFRAAGLGGRVVDAACYEILEPVKYVVVYGKQAVLGCESDNCFESIVTIVPDPVSLHRRPQSASAMSDYVMKRNFVVHLCFSAVGDTVQEFDANVSLADLPWIVLNNDSALIAVYVGFSTASSCPMSLAKDKMVSERNFEFSSIVTSSDAPSVSPMDLEIGLGYNFRVAVEPALLLISNQSTSKLTSPETCCVCERSLNLDELYDTWCQQIFRELHHVYRHLADYNTQLLEVSSSNNEATCYVNILCAGYEDSQEIDEQYYVLSLLFTWNYASGTYALNRHGNVAAAGRTLNTDRSQLSRLLIQNGDKLRSQLNSKFTSLKSNEFTFRSHSCKPVLQGESLKEISDELNGFLITK